MIRDIGAHGLSPTEFHDHVGDYLQVISGILNGQEGGSPNERGSAAWARIAREHGLLLVKQGFDKGELFHEFTVLRRVLQEFAVEDGIADYTRQNQCLVELIEGALADSVLSYVDSRDRESRRLEAEHWAS